MSDFPVHSVLETEYVSDKLLSHLNEGFYGYLQHLKGEVLTIVDSSISDPTQRKAMKDLIFKAFVSRSYLDESSLRYGMFSLSQYLRSLIDPTEDIKDAEQYEQYIKQGGMSQFGTTLAASLKENKLG